MKTKEVMVILGFFTAIFLLCGILTCEWFAWWMIPTGVVCAVYIIGFFRYEIKKVKRGEW